MTTGLVMPADSSLVLRSGAYQPTEIMRSRNGARAGQAAEGR